MKEIVSPWNLERRWHTTRKKNSQRLFLFHGIQVYLADGGEFVQNRD